MGVDIYVHTNAAPCTEEEARLISAAECRYDVAERMGLELPKPCAFPRRCADLNAPAYRTKSRHVTGMPYSRYNIWREALAVLVGVELKPEWPDGVDPMMAAILGIRPRACLTSFWRDVAQIEDAGGIPTTPLWQLLHFSDCEGTLGPGVCRELADGFDAFAEKAAAHGDEWWREVYTELRVAFREAADTGGWVSFG